MIDDAFAPLLGLRWESAEDLRLTIRPEHVNTVGLLLGPVVFALADYGMTSVLLPRLQADEMCATTNVAINFVDSAAAGEVVCRSRLERRTRRTAATACEIRHEGRLLATAIGSFVIRPARTAASPPA
jgi:acyl-CoA thioesterase